MIAYTAEGTVGISARSKGEINVQILMERMQGGGHFSAAALSREHAEVSELEAELKAVIDEYLNEQEEREDESDSVK